MFSHFAFKKENILTPFTIITIIENTLHMDFHLYSLVVIVHTCLSIVPIRHTYLFLCNASHTYRKKYKQFDAAKSVLMLNVVLQKMRKF